MRPVAIHAEPFRGVPRQLREFRGFAFVVAVSLWLANQPRRDPQILNVIQPPTANHLLELA